MPPSVAVPFPLSLKVTPFGSAPISASEGMGVPVAVTVKLLADPAVKVVVLALVIAAAIGAGFTVSVKFCVASRPELLWAVIVSE